VHRAARILGRYRVKPLLLVSCSEWQNRSAVSLAFRSVGLYRVIWSFRRMSQHAGVYAGISYAPPELQSGAGRGCGRYWRAAKGSPGVHTIVAEPSKPGIHKKPHQEPPAHHTAMRISVRALSGGSCEADSKEPRTGQWLQGL
jgi:hypothetical protein